MSNLVKTLLISFTVIVVTAVASFFLFTKYFAGDSEDKQRSIDEINDLSYVSPEVTTDLIDGKFVRIQFQIVTDSKNALKEVEKREFQIKNIIIKELAVMNEEDFTTQLDQTERALQDSLNEVMTEGKITDVYTISKILQ